MTTTAATIARIDDHEFEGQCLHCGREGLRWIVTLSDGRSAGVECIKKILGWKPAPKSYNWVADFAPVAEHTDCGEVFVLWQHKTGTATRETRNGALVQVGGVSQAWTRRGWAV